VSKGPDLVKDNVGSKISGAGGPGALAKGALAKGGEAAGGVGNVVGGIADKVTGKGKGDKKPTGHGRGRRLPVQEYIDVGVDIETVYDQFTQFEDWPNFMHRLEKVEQKDETTVMFNENIWGVRRSWEAEIVEQKPCERVVWRSNGPVATVGVATFHRLSDNLTRIQINMDHQPKGLFEKTASGTRISRRALRSDLMRFKAFVEMRDDATGAWRGVVEEGEVAESPEEREEKRDGDEAEASAEPATRTPRTTRRRSPRPPRRRRRRSRSPRRPRRTRSTRTTTRKRRNRRPPPRTRRRSRRRKKGARRRRPRGRPDGADHAPARRRRRPGHGGASPSWP
jgi:uncharacterized membrane protein